MRAMDTTAEIRPADSLADLATTANAEAARGAESLCIAGDALLKAKKMVPHGEWKSWLLKNWRYSYRHAVRLMRAAEVVGRSNPDNVLTAIALPDTFDPETPPKVTSMSPLMTHESSHNGHHNGTTVNQPTVYVYEEIDVPEDRPAVPSPPAPPERQPKPEPASRWLEFAPKTIRAEPKREPMAADEVLNALTRAARRLTVFMNETPEGERFMTYLRYCNLGHFVEHVDITIKGRTFKKKFIGLRALRRIAGLACRKREYTAAQFRQLMEELHPEDGE